MQAWLDAVLAGLSLPAFGLGGLFVAAFVSATLLPLASEAVLVGVLSAHPSMLWPALVVATVGNTAGGAVSWWMGRGAEHAVERITNRSTLAHPRALRWLERFGPKACLLAWLPVIGDPLCAVAGWLKLPFWPCVAYMAIGKFARYLTFAGALRWVLPGVAA